MSDAAAQCRSPSPSGIAVEDVTGDGRAEIVLADMVAVDASPGLVVFRQT